MGDIKAVLGEGPVGTPLALVGEQAGDQEDLLGQPFVGPAGRLLDRVLKAASSCRARGEPEPAAVLSVPL